MHRRDLIRHGAVLIAGGALMPVSTIRTQPDDPRDIAARASELRTRFATHGAAVIAEGEALAESVAQRDRSAAIAGDTRLADAYSRLYADLAQWLALACLKTGADDRSTLWGRRATAVATDARAWDTAAVALCRRAGIAKAADPSRALELLGTARGLPAGPWAQAMVAQHMGTVYATYSSEWTATALGQIDLAEQHLTIAVRDHGPAQRPWWAGSPERPLSVTFRGLDYRRAEILIRDQPRTAERYLDGVEAETARGSISAAGVRIRRAMVAERLGDADGAATLALEAWRVLAPAGIGRDTDRIRRLSVALTTQSDGRAVKELADAVET